MLPVRLARRSRLELGIRNVGLCGEQTRRRRLRFNAVLRSALRSGRRVAGDEGFATVA